MGSFRVGIVGLAVWAVAGSVAAAPMPPAATYHAPVAAPFEPSLDMFTLAELVSAPATRALLETVDPLLANSGIHKFLGYYTVPQLRKFFPKSITPENLARANLALARLPRNELPAQ